MSTFSTLDVPPAVPAPPSFLFGANEQLSVGLAHASADGDAAEAAADGADKGDGLNVFGMALDIGGVYAALLQAACVLVVVGGLEASKYTVNTFCVAKVRRAFILFSLSGTAAVD